MFCSTRTDRTTDRAAEARTSVQDQMSNAKESAKARAAVVADRASLLAEQAAELAATSRASAGGLSASTRETAASLREAAASLREAAAPTLHDASDVARERLAMAKEKAAPTLQEAVERARPTVEAAQSALVESVLPKVSAAITTAAAGLSEAKGGAAPYVEHARETAHVSNERARDALKVLKGEATIKERRSKGKWLIGIGLVAAIIAAVAAFRQKKQADDPWATPLSDVSSAPSLKDRATEKVTGLTHAKDHTGELGESELIGGGGAAGTASVGVTEPTETLGGGANGAEAGTANAQMDADQLAADELDDEAAEEDDNGRGV